MIPERIAVPASKHIGIAAVSAEGAALCYRTICTEGASILGRHGHPQVSMHTFPLGEYMRFIEADDWLEAGGLLMQSATNLVDAGAEILICPDNTLHRGLDLVRDRSPVPWLHIAEEVAALAAAWNFRRLGILGTRYLMEGPVYPTKLAAKGIEHVIPEPPDREAINAIIFDELVYGCFEDRSRTYVLGCTEIPLLVSESDSPLPALDSTRILARAALREATRDLAS